MSLKPIAAYNPAGYFPKATDGSDLTNLQAMTLIGPAATRSCNILWVDYNTAVPMAQRDGTIAYPYLTQDEAVAYIATQPANSAWLIRSGPGTEPAPISLPAGYTFIFEGHNPDVSIMAGQIQTVDLPYASVLKYININAGDTAVIDGGSPNTLLIQTENATRGSIAQTGTSLVYVIDTGSINEGFPNTFSGGIVEGDTAVTGKISGTNIIYAAGCDNLNGQLVQLSGCSIEAAAITVVETAIILMTDWKFYYPQINNNAGDSAIEVYLDAASTKSWNDKRGTAPVNTFVTIN